VEEVGTMAIRLSHRGICVADIAESLRFYRDGLGFAAADLYEMDDPALSTVMEVPGSVIRAQMVRNAQGVMFELLQFVQPGASGPRERRPNNQYGLTHLAFYVDDMDEAAAQVRAAGGQVWDHTRATFRANSTTMMYCADPNGTRIELMHDPRTPARFSHSGICVTDIDRSMRFFDQAIGFAPAENYALSDHSDWLDIVNELPGVKLRAQMVRSAEGNTIELLKMDSPECFGPRERRAMNRYGLTHLAFYVDDIDAVAAAVTANGGRTYPHTRSTFTSGIEIMYCTDPDGVRVELMQTPS
jgi:catechol 2,3-dioxygenase-like lactoylglutathione lyase family enzyme